MDGFRLNFQDSFGMIQGPIDQILMIRKESWILDHSPGGGLRSLSVMCTSVICFYVRVFYSYEFNNFQLQPISHA